jgi:hypothetical protein
MNESSKGVCPKRRYCLPIVRKDGHELFRASVSTAIVRATRRRLALQCLQRGGPLTLDIRLESGSAPRIAVFEASGHAIRVLFPAFSGGLR